MKIFRVTTVPISLKVLLKGQLNFMSRQGFEVLGVSSAGKELEDVCKEEKVNVLELEMSRTISPLKDFKSLYRFYQLCKKEKPLIVHSHTPKAGIVGMLGAKLADVPIRIHTVAGLPLMEATGMKRIVLDFVEKLTYTCATKVYPNSKGLYDFILKNNYTSIDKLKVIGKGSSNGIDTSYFNPKHFPEEETKSLKKSLGIKNEDFVFIFVGRLVGDKGINELIFAFSEICTLNNSMGCKLLLVGPTESGLDPLLPRTLQEIERNSNIISVGFQKDVRVYFAIADVLVFPSYREGFPNVVLQAGAMGLPCIVSDINGCNEIIVAEENGDIIPVKDHEAVLQAMAKMMSDKSYYRNIKRNARKMIQERYEQGTVWDALLQEYNTLLKEKGF